MRSRMRTTRRPYASASTAVPRLTTPNATSSVSASRRSPEGIAHWKMSEVATGRARPARPPNAASRRNVHTSQPWPRRAQRTRSVQRSLGGRSGTKATASTSTVSAAALSSGSIVRSAPSMSNPLPCRVRTAAGAPERSTYRGTATPPRHRPVSATGQESQPEDATSAASGERACSTRACAGRSGMPRSLPMTERASRRGST